jgi:hypothetical protein
MPKGLQGQRLPHYMVDCLFPEKGQFDGFRKESFPVKVPSESDAINAAKRTAFGKKPHHFHVRAVGRKSDTVIFSSENA